jgi:hypothetical protein
MKSVRDFLIRNLNNFRNNKTGLFLTVMVAVIIMFVATTSWLVIIKATNNFVDTFTMFAVGPWTAQLGQESLISGSVVVGIIDLGMFIWILVAALNRNGEEQTIDI